MQAYELVEYSGPEGLRLTRKPEPVGDDTSVVVAVKAIGVNFPDLLLTQGQYQFKPDLPFTPGCEIAGVVASSPVGSEFLVGDRVAAFVWQGGFAEFAEVPLDHLIRLPDEMDFESAAALLVNHQTVYFALVRRGSLRSGEGVLVLGAGGGIGSAAVQVANGLGARVIAGIADEAQSDTARQAGAHDVIILRKGFSKEVLGLTDGRGVNVVVDPLGDWLFTEATRALAPEGRILIVGFAAGEIPTIKANRLLLKNISAVGVAWGASLAQDPSVLADGAAALDRMFREGTVRPLIGRVFAFDEIPEALLQLSTSQIPGKGVVKGASR